MLNLKDLFRITQFGVQDARQIANKSKEFIEAKYGVRVKIKKESENSWSGGAVTGGANREITLFIETKEKFDLKDFMNELNQCEFVYEGHQGKNVWVFSIQSYIINVNINGKLVEFDKKWRGIAITDDMVLRYVFNDEDYSNTFKDYFEKDENDKWVLKK